MSKYTCNISVDIEGSITIDAQPFLQWLATTETPMTGLMEMLSTYYPGSIPKDAHINDVGITDEKLWAHYSYTTA